MKDPCALCHEIAAYSAACTPAKREIKRCLMIGEGRYGIASRLTLHPIQCLCGSCAPPLSEKRKSSDPLLECSMQQPLSNASTPTPKIERISSPSPCEIAFSIVRSHLIPEKKNNANRCTHLCQWAVQGCSLSSEHCLTANVPLHAALLSSAARQGFVFPVCLVCLLCRF